MKSGQQIPGLEPRTLDLHARMLTTVLTSVDHWLCECSCRKYQLRLGTVTPTGGGGDERLHLALPPNTPDTWP